MSLTGNEKRIFDGLWDLRLKRIDHINYYDSFSDWSHKHQESLEYIYDSEEVFLYMTLEEFLYDRWTAIPRVREINKI